MTQWLGAQLQTGGLTKGGLHTGLSGLNIFGGASLDLNFAVNKNLGPLVTFTRSSSATYVGSDGLIKTATTNLLLRSEEFDSASWAKDATTVSANQVAAPNGTNTADKVAEDSTNNFHAISQYVSGFASGAVLSISIYAQAAGRTKFRLQTDSTGGSGTADFDLTAVTATAGTGVFSNGTIQSVGGSWYRCSVRCTTSGAGSIGLKVLLAATTFGTSYTGDGTSGLYLWGAQLEQSSTVGEYIPTTSTINSEPRFDHNPTTGESLGLLVEEQRMNSIRNNTMVGAVAGTPGTAPTNWIVTAATDLTRTIVGTGTENGVTYIDLRFTGTVTAARTQYVFFEGSAAIAASNNQPWAGSAWVKVAGGSLSNITSMVLQADTRDSSFAYVNTPYALSIYSNVSSVFTRFNASGNTAAANVAYVQPFLAFTTATSGAIDITLRIGLPQLEQGAFATSVIPTTTAAATRSADVASLTGTAFSSWYRQDEGTAYVECAVAQPNSGGNQFAFRVSDNGYSNSIAWNISATGYAALSTSAGGVFDGLASGPVPLTANASAKFAAGYQANNLAISLAGAAPVVDTSATIPAGLNRADIGSDHAGANRVKAGTIRRLTYFPQRLPNTTLQAITQ